MLFQALVYALVFGLGSPTYKVREICEKSLIAINNEFDLRLYLSPSSDDLERNERINRIVNEYSNIYKIYSIKNIPRIEHLCPSMDGKIYIKILKDNNFEYELCEGVYRTADCFHRYLSLEFLRESIKSGMTRQKAAELVKEGINHESNNPNVEWLYIREDD